MHFFFCWLGVTPKNRPKVKKGGLKIKKNCTKTGITQVTGQLQQKLFYQQLALDLGLRKMWF